MLRFLKCFALLPFFYFSLTLQIEAQDRLSGELFATRSEVIARHGMAATNHPLASQIAIDILKQGGSAADAAIAANAFLGLQPHEAAHKRVIGCRRRDKIPQTSMS